MNMKSGNLIENVAVILPVYNTAPYLEETLASLSRQTDPHWTAFCVNDGSTDGSGQMLDAAVRKDARIRVIHQPNHGVASARNRVLTYLGHEKDPGTRFPYCVFLDSDDILAPTLFEACRKTLEQVPTADAVRFEAVRSVDFKEYPSFKEINALDSVPVHQRDVEGWIRNRDVQSNFCQYLYRTAGVSDARFPAYRVGEDRVWFATWLTRPKQIVDIPLVGYGYRITPGSATMQRETPEKVRNVIDFYRDVLQVWNSSGRKLENAVRRHVANMIIEGIPYRLFKLPQRKCQTLWSAWFDLLPQVCLLYPLSRWRRLTLFLLTHTRSRLLAICLGAWPHALKLRGLHR